MISSPERKGEGSAWPRTALSIWRGEIRLSGPTMAEIAQAVAERYGLTLEQLRGRDRARSFAWPRQEAMAEIHAAGRCSTTAIGRYFGGRDHSTVVYAIQAVRERRAAEREAA